jgi:ketosteroid isomerase-like protein
LLPRCIVTQKRVFVTIMSTSFDTIDAANRRFEELFNAGKLDELVGLYTSEGKLLPPDKNKYEGREQIKKFWQGARDAGVDNLRLTTGTVLEAGEDRLIETSAYQHSLDRGNYQVIWKRSGEGKGEWELDIDIFN